MGRGVCLQNSADVPNVPPKSLFEKTNEASPRKIKMEP